MAMGTRRQRQRQEELWYTRGSGGSSGPSLLSSAERVVGSGGLRGVLRSTLPKVLSREAGASVAGAGDLLPGDADRIFRRDRERARNCVEGSGFIVLAGVSANRTG